MEEKINGETIKHLATLARIELEQDEKKNKKLISDLSSILDYFEDLKSVDTSEISSFGGVSGQKDVYRKDGIKDISKESLLKSQFPQSENGFLKIPRVFE
jgi:aspartyl-tRNA(Asn)/glutamyl-tRNA(Gln) amidotransferase subunit C